MTCGDLHVTVPCCALLCLAASCCALLHGSPRCCRDLHAAAAISTLLQRSPRCCSDLHVAAAISMLLHGLAIPGLVFATPQHPIHPFAKIISHTPSNVTSIP